MVSVPARTVIAALLALSLLALPLATASGSAAGYTLSVDETIDVPDRTVSLEGDEYQIDRMAAVDVGQSIAVSVEAPTDNRSYVYLYNADRDRMDVTTGFGSFEDSFDTGYLDPGTYLVAHYYDGSYHTLVPVVVNGYDMTSDHVSEATVGDDLNVSATVTPTDSTGQPDTVEVAVWNDERQEQVELTQQGSGEYTGTVSLDGFEPGEYNIHIAARSDEELRDGRNELLALRGSHSLEVAAHSTESTTESTGTGGSGGSGGGGAPATAEPTTETTATATPTTATATPTTPTETPTATSSTTTTGEPSTATTMPTDDSVLTPNSGTETTAAATDSEARVPLSPVLAILAFVLSSLVLWRRS